MKSKLFITFFICQFTIVNFIFAQDPQFTQSFGAMSYNNPSFVGSDTMGTVFISHRNQWPKLSGSYLTTVVGWQQYIGPLNSYAGFHVMNDKANALTTTRISFNYAQNIKIKNVLLRPAFEFTYFQKTLDWEKLTFGDMIDPRRGFVYQTGDIPSGNGSMSNIDFSAGILSSFYNFNIGISVHHLAQPNESIIGGNSPLPMKIGLQLGYSFEMAIGPGPLRFDPYFMYYSQGNFQMMQFGMNACFKNILIGMSARRLDALAFLAGYRHQRFTVAYSYDMTTSGLTNEATGGSHEFTLAFRFWKVKSHSKFIETKSPFQ